MKKALYISQQLSPYVPETPMAVAGRALSQALQESGVEVRTFMPKYGCINERRNQLHEVIRLSGLNIVIDDNDHPLIIKVATLLPTRMQVYFIDNDDYFHRLAKAGLETELEPADNDERMMFFTRGVIETVKRLRWAPALIHCSGWLSSLAPLYIRRKHSTDPALTDSKIVYSIFNHDTPADMDPRLVDKLLQDGFKRKDLAALADGNAVNAAVLGRLAVDYSDAVVIADPDADAELVAYAKASGKPVLDCGQCPEPAQVIEFYSTLLDK